MVCAHGVRSNTEGTEVRSLKESIGFSSELASIYAESIRVISEICRSRFGLTYSQFVVMKILSSAEEGLRAGDLACTVGLKIGSLWLLLLDLEDKGLIVKESEEDDRRVMRCSLSVEGASVIAECNSEVLDTLVKRYWVALPDREFFEYARPTIDDNLARLKGESADSAGVPHSPSDVLTASFLVFLRVLTEQSNRSVPLASAYPSRGEASRAAGRRRDSPERCKRGLVYDEEPRYSVEGPDERTGSYSREGKPG